MPNLDQKNIQVENKKESVPFKEKLDGTLFFILLLSTILIIPLLKFISIIFFAK